MATEIKLIDKVYKGAELIHEYVEQFDYSWFFLSRSQFFKDDIRFDCEFIKMKYDKKANELIVIWSVVEEKPI